MSDSKFRLTYRSVPLPWALVEDREVPDGAKVLYAVILTLVDWRTMETKLSQAELARKAGRTTRTIREQLGFLSVRKYVDAAYDQASHVTTYTLLLGDGVGKEVPRPPEEKRHRLGQETSEAQSVVVGVETPRGFSDSTSAPLAPVKVLVDDLYQAMATASGVTKLVNFNGGQASSLFSKALKSGESIETLRTVIRRFATHSRNLTVPAFASQLDALRGEVQMGRQVAQRQGGRFAGGGLADSDAHLR